MSGALGTDVSSIRRAYDAFDTQQRGFVELADIKAVLGDEAADAIAELVARVHIAGDGRITFDTFLAAMTAGACTNVGGCWIFFLSTRVTACQHPPVVHQRMCANRTLPRRAACGASRWP